ncbi:MAG: amidohydrolase family protein [Ectothiorhodospiraceae bacterium]|nr:amidohydrolase family protein [Chromatiales bacterium]MCP5155651.1 amidohydrolase family protein [Ectothiorhodospiraceae bacterium]
MNDLVIRDALIVDGLGNAPRHGSLAVKDGRIVAVGDDVGAGRETVDAEGLALAPGIVDLHTHYDAQLTWDPYANPSLGLGVTTVVIGNCGFTIAPCKPQHRDITLRNLTHVEGMSLDALRTGVDWQFESYPEYLDSLERKGTVPNVASFVGHSSVRTFVLGEEASSRAASAKEVEQMRALVVEAMRAGACGFATSTLEQHNGENGIPMPSRLADDHEMKALTGALGEVGKGVFMLTKGMKSTIPWLEEIAASNGRPVMIAAMFIDPNDPERVFREVGQIGEARARGRELWAQVGCFPLGMEFSLAHPYPLEAFLAWRPAIEAEGSDAYRRVLGDPSFRAAIKAEARTAGVPNRFSYHQFAHMRIMSVERPEHRELVGQCVGDLAAAAGKDPFDWFLDFGLEGELDAMVDCKMFNIDEARLPALLSHPHTAVALSDAGAHLSFLCDADFGLHLLGYWCREKGALSLQDAVRTVTSRVADVYRIPDRGRLVPGAFADLLMFDPATVGRTEKVRAADLPAGASRVTRAPKGVHGVWVNGVRAVGTEGVIEGCGRPGRLIRDFRA